MPTNKSHCCLLTMNNTMPERKSPIPRMDLGISVSRFSAMVRSGVKRITTKPLRELRYPYTAAPCWRISSFNCSGSRMPTVLLDMEPKQPMSTTASTTQRCFSTVRTERFSSTGFSYSPKHVSCSPSSDTAFSGLTKRKISAVDTKMDKPFNKNARLVWNSNSTPPMLAPNTKPRL